MFENVIGQDQETNKHSQLHRSEMDTSPPLYSKSYFPQEITPQQKSRLWSQLADKSSAVAACHCQ